MAWPPTYHPAWTNFPTQTEGVGIHEAVHFIRNFTYPPPKGYMFLNPLGAGGCGKVYLATHSFTGCLYAVKCVKIINEYTSHVADLLWKEIMILNGKPHPHLITCYGAWQSPTDSSIRYLFLEYMEMGSVKDFYSNHSNMITEAFVRECISHVLVGLVHIHSQRIIHRDIKGENILNMLKNDKRIFKIADFGLSKLCDIDSSGVNCLMTAGVGTTTHMAPEVKNPTVYGQYDWMADIWSLGCLVLEILSRGTLTVEVDNHQAEYTRPPGISLQCTHFIQCCLQVNPANRHTSSMLLSHEWFKILLQDKAINEPN